MNKVSKSTVFVLLIIVATITTISTIGLVNAVTANTKLRKEVKGYKACYDNHNINMVEPDNSYSRPVKGMKPKDSLDSLHIPHIIFDKELNGYAISLAGNKLEDIDNCDELVEQMNILEYNRNKYKDCTIEDIKLVGTHCDDDNIHQAAEAIRYNLSHKDNPYNEGYDAGYDTGYDTGYETAKRELENK